MQHCGIELDGIVAQLKRIIRRYDHTIARFPCVSEDRRRFPFEIVFESYRIRSVVRPEFPNDGPDAVARWSHRSRNVGGIVFVREGSDPGKIGR